MTDDRIAALRELMHRWLDCPLDAPEREIAAPRPLRAFAGLLGGRSLSGEHELNVRRDGRRLVFYAMNQGADEWATTLDGEDPPVHVASSDGWQLECARLSDFLLGVAVLEAINAAPHRIARRVTSRNTDEVLRLAPPMPLAPWASYDRQFLAGDGVIGTLSDGHLTLVSLDDASLQRLASLFE